LACAIIGGPRNIGGGGDLDRCDDVEFMSDKINLADKLAQFEGYWQPRVVAASTAAT
jgi:hypothetical protein